MMGPPFMAPGIAEAQSAPSSTSSSVLLGLGIIALIILLVGFCGWLLGQRRASVGKCPGCGATRRGKYCPVCGQEQN